jgi:aminomethyltransferase
MMIHPELLQKTPLNRHHHQEGAKLVEFGGWEMPLQFTKVLEEHKAVRTAAGLFDISHMGVLSIHSGNPQVTMEALNALIPQDLLKVYPGKAVYTQLLNEFAGILDDIIVYWMPETQHFQKFPEFMVICNASNTAKVISWFKQHLPEGVQVDRMNDRYSLLALQGPRFEDVLSACWLSPQSPLPKRFHIGEYTLFDQPVLLSRTGYTGEDGVEILVSANMAETLWKALLRGGRPLALRQIGLAARDTLRLEAAYPLYGADLSEEITPLEAGLGWSVKLDQAEDFIGKAALLKQQAEGLQRYFVCFEVLKKSIPRQHDLLYDRESNIIGEVTSGSISPTLQKPIGVGYVTLPSAPQPGSLLKVNIRGCLVDVKCVDRPFYRK